MSVFKEVVTKHPKNLALCVKRTKDQADWTTWTYAEYVRCMMV